MLDRDPQDTWLAEAYFIREAHPVGKPPAKQRFQINARPFNAEIVQLTDGGRVVMPWQDPPTLRHQLSEATLALLERARGKPYVDEPVERSVCGLATVEFGTAIIGPNGWSVYAWGASEEAVSALAAAKLLTLKR